MPSADVQRLAEVMREVHSERPPVTLPFFLGDECARAAGVPSQASMGRHVFEQLADTAAARSVQALLPDWPHSSDEAVGLAFAAWLGRQSRVQRYKIFEPFYRSIPVPLFYRDFADLVVAGFVTDILTTNVDSLLEQALDTAGLSRGRDYSVIVVGATEQPTEPTPVSIVKLQGDLGQELLPVGFDEMEKALYRARKQYKTELASEMVVVGHEPDSPLSPIDEWLVRRSGGDVWWVHPDPDLERLRPIQASRPVILLVGHEVGEPAVFFGQLALHLLRLPALQAAGALPAEPATELSAEQLEREYYKGQLLKSKTVTYTLQQQRVPGLVDDVLEQRLAYQQQLESALVDQVKSTVEEPSAASVDNLVDLLRSLVQQASQSDAHVSPSVLKFLDSQAAAVDQEVRAPTPDPAICAAAAQAAHSVAARSLGDVVEPATLERLSAAVRQLDSGFAAGDWQ